MSRFTIVLYLNDDFSGGQTTFFLPGQDGEIVARQAPTIARINIDGIELRLHHPQKMFLFLVW